MGGHECSQPTPKSPNVQTGDGLEYLLNCIENLTFTAWLSYEHLADLFHTGCSSRSDVSVNSGCLFAHCIKDAFALYMSVLAISTTHNSSGIRVNASYELRAQR